MSLMSTKSKILPYEKIEDVSHSLCTLNIDCCEPPEMNNIMCRMRMRGMGMSRGVNVEKCGLGVVKTIRVLFITLSIARHSARIKYR
jgi:hypothetical protein